MKTEKKIFLAFILNLLFSVLECIGGLLTGSIAVISDALHDFGDALGIGVSFFFEKKSKKSPNDVYTYGYARFSVLGGAITSLILLVGTVAVVVGAVHRILHPVAIYYDGLLVLAVVGLLVNLVAVYCTHGGRSINQRAVNLHMLEDALGWVVLFIGALVMRFTGLWWLDPMLSIAVALFVGYHACKNMKSVLDIFLLKKPTGVDLEEIKTHLLGVEGVMDVHHFHVWTLDGESVYATLHVKAKGDLETVKRAVKDELKEHGVLHATLEMEGETEDCLDAVCTVQNKPHAHHHCHHH